MDIGSPCEKAISKALPGGLVNALDGNSDEVLSIKDSSERNTSDGGVVSHVEEGFEDLKLEDDGPGQKSLCKYATFPPTAKISPSANVNEQDEDDELKTALEQMFSDDPVPSRCSRSLSLPVSHLVIYDGLWVFILLSCCFSFIFNVWGIQITSVQKCPVWIKRLDCQDYFSYVCW